MSDDERKRRVRRANSRVFWLVVALVIAAFGLGTCISFGGAAATDTAREPGLQAGEAGAGELAASPQTPATDTERSRMDTGPLQSASGGVDDRQHDRFAALDSTGWPERVKRAFPIIVRHSYRHDLSPWILMGIAHKESRFRLGAETSCCHGIYQLHQMHGHDVQRLKTDLEYSVKSGVEWFAHEMDQHDWHTTTALRAYRGFGYEPGYPADVRRYAAEYKQEWQEAKNETTD